VAHGSGALSFGRTIVEVADKQASVRSDHDHPSWQSSVCEARKRQKTVGFLVHIKRDRGEKGAGTNSIMRDRVVYAFD
jgi:hypothetical protein